MKHFQIPFRILPWPYLHLNYKPLWMDSLTSLVAFHYAHFFSKSFDLQKWEKKWFQNNKFSHYDIHLMSSPAYCPRFQPCKNLDDCKQPRLCLVKILAPEFLTGEILSAESLPFLCMSDHTGQRSWKKIYWRQAFELGHKMGGCFR